MCRRVEPNNTQQNMDLYIFVVEYFDKKKNKKEEDNKMIQNNIKTRTHVLLFMQIHNIISNKIIHTNYLFNYI